MRMMFKAADVECMLYNCLLNLWFVIVAMGCHQGRIYTQAKWENFGGGNKYCNAVTFCVSFFSYPAVLSI
jgi:hypothetical protein